MVWNIHNITTKQTILLQNEYAGLWCGDGLDSFHSLQLIFIVQQYWSQVVIGYGCWVGLAFSIVQLVYSKS